MPKAPNRTSRDRIRNTNNSSDNKSSNVNNRPWTYVEDLLLACCLGRGKSVAAIAYRLRRSIPAVQQRQERLARVLVLDGDLTLKEASRVLNIPIKTLVNSLSSTLTKKPKSLRVILSSKDTDDTESDSENDSSDDDETGGDESRMF